MITISTVVEFDFDGFDEVSQFVNVLIDYKFDIYK